jgi:hypothetical protein
VASGPVASSTSTPPSGACPAAAGGLVGRILRGVDDARDSGLQDRLGAGRLPARVGARLEGDEERRARRVLAAGAAVLDRGALRVQVSELGVESSPITASSRTSTAPTSGFGLTRPRPPSASASARRRCASWDSVPTAMFAS